jgi:polyhydroxyalkanoate synthesis regulator protein
MKTSFEKFMASTAVNKVELGKAEMINVQLGAKEDLIKLINSASKLVGPARKLEDSTSKFADQLTTLKKQVPEFITKNKEMAAQLASLDSQIKSGYEKFQAQLKALGVPKDAVSDLETAMKSLNDNDFYPLQRDLTFNTTYLDKLK